LQVGNFFYTIYTFFVQRPLLSIFVFLVIAGAVSAQDPHFSQFFAAPLHVNPALSGVFNGSFRAGLNHRQQWASVIGTKPFVTSHGGFDYRRRVFRGDYWSVGMSMYNDFVGVGRLERNSANLGFSYSKQLDGSRYRTRDMYLVAGFQAGVGQQAIDYSKLWFSRQWDPTGETIDYSINPGENPAEKTDMYPDFQAGLLWYMIFDDDASFYLGGAMHHINQPKVSFLGLLNETLTPKFTVNVGGQFPFNNEWSMLPSAIMMMQGPSMQINSGAQLRYTNRSWKDIAWRVGLHNRIANRYEKGILMDALIVSTIFEMQRYNFGLSYDVNTSILRQVSSRRGAIEVSLSYVLPEKSRYRTRCPKF
jgi:type IX secretion system PorP/SprF family membrane protein